MSSAPLDRSGTRGAGRLAGLARWKARCVLALLVASTLWPLAHHALAQAFDWNPWKWFGWAMYTTPARRVRAEAWTPEGRPLNLAGVPPAAAERALAAYREWSNRRIELGGSAAPDAFAEALFAAYPEVAAFEVRAFDVRMERASASFVERPAAGSPWSYRRHEAR